MNNSQALAYNAHPKIVLPTRHSQHSQVSQQGTKLIILNPVLLMVTSAKRKPSAIKQTIICLCRYLLLQLQQKYFVLQHRSLGFIGSVKLNTRQYHDLFCRIFTNKRVALANSANSANQLVSTGFTASEPLRIAVNLIFKQVTFATEMQALRSMTVLGKVL